MGYNQETVQCINDISWSNVLVVESMFANARRFQTLVEAKRLFFLGLGRDVVMSPGGVLFCEKCMGTLDGIVVQTRMSYH